MSASVVLIVLAAAFLHATWNAMIKGAADRVVTMGLINVGHGLIGLWMVLAYMPPLREAWVFILASTLIHWFYYIFLVISYRYGDLSRVYPIARGIAPVLVASGGLWLAGDELSVRGWGGLILVSIGIGLLALERGTGGDRRAVIAALLTGITIAAYSVADGMGARASGSVMGYIGWLFVMEAFAAFGFLWWGRKNLRSLSKRALAIGVLGGVVSAVAYGLAIYAKSVAPFGAVSAIRESSVLIAALIGVTWFGERPIYYRISSGIIVAAGVATLALYA